MTGKKMWNRRGINKFQLPSESYINENVLNNVITHDSLAMRMTSIVSMFLKNGIYLKISYFSILNKFFNADREYTFIVVASLNSKYYLVAL